MIGRKLPKQVYVKVEGGNDPYLQAATDPKDFQEDGLVGVYTLEYLVDRATIVYLRRRSEAKSKRRKK